MPDATAPAETAEVWVPCNATWEDQLAQRRRAWVIEGVGKTPEQVSVLTITRADLDQLIEAAIAARFGEGKTEQQLLEEAAAAAGQPSGAAAPPATEAEATARSQDAQAAAADVGSQLAALKARSDQLEAELATLRAGQPAAPAVPAAQPGQPPAPAA